QLCYALCVSCRCRHHRRSQSFPTRRSSDLGCVNATFAKEKYFKFKGLHRTVLPPYMFFYDLLYTCNAEGILQVSGFGLVGVSCEDRKSTRLNSSHVKISYAVFCLKKKIKKN